MSKFTRRPPRKVARSNQSRTASRARTTRPNPQAPPTYRHGFPPAIWLAAKKEARQAMIQTASARRTMTYTQLAEKITAIAFDPRDFLLAVLLDEISRDEERAGNNMLTAVVVHKYDGYPGAGFFKLAKQLGRNTSCRITFWAKELSKVHEVWRK